VIITEGRLRLVQASRSPKATPSPRSTMARALHRPTRHTLQAQDLTGARAAHTCTYCGNRVNPGHEDLVPTTNAQYMHVTGHGCREAQTRADSSLGSMWRKQPAFVTTEPLEPDWDFGWPADC
jgi:hypothetical protein